MCDSDDDCDLDRLLQIDEEMMTENKPAKVVTPPQGLAVKRALEDTCNLHSRDGISTAGVKRRKSVFVQNNNQTLEPPNPLMDTCQPPPDRSVLHKRIPLEGDYVSVTFSHGKRFYLEVSEQDTDVSIIPLRFESIDLAEAAKGLLRQRTEKPSQNIQCVEHTKTNSSALWAAKYAPANYVDLISDETINRTLLRWIKAWDPYVFGAPVPTSVQSAAINTGSTVKQSFSRTEDLEKMAGELDPRDGLPRYRLVLLTGCPGLGKTTLAHLLAQHAGYQVIEINASDERTVTAFKDQLTAIVSSTTSLDPVSASSETTRTVLKPCCLILDEIDGAVPAAVELLATAAKCTLQSNAERRGRQKRNVSPLILRRPVICICNDLFAASVRPLRAPGVPCLILRLPCVDLGRLISRLDLISRKEGLPADKIVLTQLAEMADRDIRACLNALQFLKSHFNEACSSSSIKQFSLDDLTTMTSFGSGLKDVQRSLFDVWKAVFTIPSAHILSGRVHRRFQAARLIRDTSEFRDLKQGRSVMDSESTLTARLEYLREIVESAGDAQPMTMGIFENYLNCRMKDSSLNVARQASTWFTYHDLIFRRIHSNTDFSLLRYTSHLPAWFHLTLATPLGLTNGSGTARGTSYLHWPTAHTEANAKRQQCSSILDQLLINQWTAPGLYGTEVLGSNANSFRFLPRRRFLLDVASSTLRLLSLTASSLRPLNAQLYSQQETVHLANLVSLMLNLGLDLSPQQNAETGEVELHLDPRLDQVVCFSSNTSTAMRNIAHTTKQLIARELAVERMRRAARNLNAATNSVNRHPMQPKLSPKLNPSSVVSVPLNSSTDKKSKIRCDFFGRPLTDTRTTGVVSNKTKKIDNDSENPRLINRALYYRFREGYSNAVRRPVTMKHFL